MSISSEITRISNAKTAIAESIANKGVTVPSGTKIDGMATLIDSIPTGGGGGDTSETWVLNESPSITRNTFIDTQIQFVSNGQTFSRINIARIEVNGIKYDDVYVYNAIGDETIGPHWVLENYRKVTFATAPTGDLLTWLQSNAVKQASDTAVQPSKALTVTSNGTTTITPDVPYDAIKQVDLTVNVTSGGGEMVSLTVTAGGPAMGKPNIWYCSDDGVKQMESYKTPVQCLKNSMVACGGGLRKFTGLIELASAPAGTYIYQITDNATATHGT